MHEAGVWSTWGRLRSVRDAYAQARRSCDALMCENDHVHVLCTLYSRATHETVSVICLCKTFLMSSNDPNRCEHRGPACQGNSQAATRPCRLLEGACRRLEGPQREVSLKAAFVRLSLAAMCPASVGWPPAHMCLAPSAADSSLDTFGRMPARDFEQARAVPRLHRSSAWQHTLCATSLVGLQLSAAAPQRPGLS